jgi:hypothetical protein
MNENSVEFYLPLGLQKDDKVHRKGKMRLATTLDELEIQNNEDVGFNSRYRDMLLLSKVIEELDGLKPVTTEMIENMFEADFLYLQLLYKEIHGEMSSHMSTVCPKCEKTASIRVPSLYKDMGLFKEKS